MPESIVKYFTFNLLGDKIVETTEENFANIILSDLYVCGGCEQFGIIRENTFYHFHRPGNVSEQDKSNAERFVDELLIQL